jgi:hypothetical protein
MENRRWKTADGKPQMENRKAVLILIRAALHSFAP